MSELASLMNIYIHSYDNPNNPIYIHTYDNPDNPNNPNNPYWYPGDGTDKHSSGRGRGGAGSENRYKEESEGSDSEGGYSENEAKKFKILRARQALTDISGIITYNNL